MYRVERRVADTRPRRRLIFMRAESVAPRRHYEPVTLGIVPIAVRIDEYVADTKPQRGLCSLFSLP